MMGDEKSPFGEGPARSPFGEGPARSPFGDAAPIHDDLFGSAVRILRSGARPRPSWAPLLLMALILAIPTGGKMSLSAIAIVAGAILLRDVLRFATVHILDCPSDDMVMLPFLRRNAPPGSEPRKAWKEALVVLSGPLLSIVLVLILAVQLPAGGRLDRSALTSVLILNTFLLLPFGNFDGSRILNLVIFARSRISEVIFLVLTAVALAIVGALSKSWLLLVFGLLGVFGAYRRLGFRRAVSDFRAGGPPVPSPVERLNDMEMYRLFHAAKQVAPKAQARSNAPQAQLAPTYAGLMLRIHADATIEFPSLGMSILLLFLYGATFVLAGVTFFFVPR